MARTRSISSIETEISKVTAELQKVYILTRKNRLHGRSEPL